MGHLVRQQRPYRAFVISPIGGFDENGKDVRRRYADEVFSRIIEPACERVRGFERPLVPIRGEQNRDETDILARIIEGINEYDMVIALLSEHDPETINANVFYELGIAHAAGRPVPLLMHERQSLPFDLHAKDCIFYGDHHLDGRTDPFGPNGPGEQLQQALGRAIAMKKFYGPPFDREVSLGALGTRNRQMTIDMGDWSREILEAEKEVWFAATTCLWLVNGSISGNFLMPDQDTEEYTVNTRLSALLTDRIACGVDVTIMMNHPENPIMSLISSEHGQTDGEIMSKFDSVRNEARESYKQWMLKRDEVLRAAEEERAREPYFSEKSANAGQFRVIQVRRNAILHRMFATDKRAFLTPNFYGIGWNTGPCMDLRAYPMGATKRDITAHACILNDLHTLANLNSDGSVSPAVVELPGERAATNDNREKRRGLFGRRR